VATGETPNLAARLQAQARPGEVVLAPETRRLLGDTFDLQWLGAVALKGVDKAVEAWRVIGERAVASRFEAQHAQELTPLVGRNSEVLLLQERWASARDGEGQVVLLSGEAGIGKSRISQALRERLSAEPSTTLLWQCSPYFSSSALYPVAQQLERVAGIVAADAPAERATKLEQALVATGLGSASVGHLLRLLGLPDQGRLPAVQSAQQEKADTLMALVDGVLGLAASEPVLLLVEDAHWIDPTTEELLGQAVEHLRDARVLMLVTCRPEYVPSWGSAAQLTRLALNRLGQRPSAALIASVAQGKTVPAQVVDEIVRRTDGIPLFVEELTKTVLESGLLRETPTGYELDGPLLALAIPTTLQDSLMARLDRLAPAKEVAQVGAVIGRDFSHRLLAAVLASMPEPRLNEAIEELVKSELVFRRGVGADASCTFKHALVRDTAYNSLLTSQRVQRHGQVAACIEKLYADRLPDHLERLGEHYFAAEVWDRASQVLTRAGQKAVMGAAFEEAAGAGPPRTAGGGSPARHARGSARATADPVPPARRAAADVALPVAARRAAARGSAGDGAGRSAVAGPRPELPEPLRVDRQGGQRSGVGLCAAKSGPGARMRQGRPDDSDAVLPGADRERPGQPGRRRVGVRPEHRPAARLRRCAAVRALLRDGQSRLVGLPVVEPRPVRPGPQPCGDGAEHGGGFGRPDPAAGGAQRADAPALGAR
jgi:hypothetical protein